MSSGFEDRVRLCRESVGTLDRNGWVHVIGPPSSAEPLSWYPQGMTRVHRLFNGLTTRLLRFHPYEELVKGLSETKRRPQIHLGDICYEYLVTIDVDSETLSVWDGDDFLAADEYGEEEPTPVFTALDPVTFFDEFIFGGRYAELIDEVIEYPAQSDSDAVDEWRELLAQTN